MNAAHTPGRRAAKLLVVDAAGRLHHAERSRFADFLCPGDLLVANDAATLPASLAGVHRRSGAPIEVRLAGRASLDVDDVRDFTALVFGAGDHRTRTEDRAAPPPLAAGDTLSFGPLVATITAVLGHPRFVTLRFEGDADRVWAGMAAHGRPIQYAHVAEPLALWDVWTRIASRPVAFEAPSAGFALDWRMLQALQQRGVGFATLTHAAGLSSTGDGALDARLPLDEAYDLPRASVAAIAQTRERGGRVIAVGTTVVRALEHAGAQPAGLRAGTGLADQRLGPRSHLRIVDALVSGTHEPGSSHYELLRAFASDAVLHRADAALAARDYLTHEFGDSVLIERASAPARCRARAADELPSPSAAQPWQSA